MKVNIKKVHPDAKIPTYAKPGDAGMDLTAVSRVFVDRSAEGKPDYIEYDTGLAFEIPEGFVGFLFPRSSNSNVDMYLSNHVGVSDSQFRGTVKFRYKIDHDYDEFIELKDDKCIYYYNDLECYSTIHQVGDRIGQLIILPYPQIEFVEVDELSETERGESGFGSTNTK